MMLYIHKLYQLTPKAAEIESVSIMREIKAKTPYPFSENDLQAYLSVYFVSETDKEYIARAIALIKEVVEEIIGLASQNDAVFEAVNLQRTVNSIKDMPVALQKNLNYAENIFMWQSYLIGDFAAILGDIPKIRSDRDKQLYNQKLNRMFEKLLRNKELIFNSSDLINESEKESIAGLAESMEKGYIFHFSLEEEIKKLKYADIRQRIPEEKQRLLEKLQDKVSKIKIGIDRAYDMNMRMANLAVVLYAYIKWMNTISG